MIFRWIVAVLVVVFVVELAVVLVVVLVSIWVVMLVAVKVYCKYRYIAVRYTAMRNSCP